MKRIVAVALVAIAGVIGAASAEAQASPAATRSIQSAPPAQVSAPLSPRRCSGASCLQGVPSLGVAF